MDADTLERAALRRYLLAHPCPPDPQTTALTVIRDLPVLSRTPLTRRTRWTLHPDTRQGVTYANPCPF